MNILNNKKISNIFSDRTGVEGFLNEKTDDMILNRISSLDTTPLTYVQLNQMLALSKIPTISDGFYKYYWLQKDVDHVYDVKSLENYKKGFDFSERTIKNIDQFLWGFERMFMDFLLFFGNINRGFDSIHNKSYNDLVSYYSKKRYNTDLISKRGKPFEFEHISKNDRYLISEMVCKTYDARNRDELLEFLKKNYNKAIEQGLKSPKINDLLKGTYAESNFSNDQLSLSFNDVLDNSIKSEDEIEKYCNEIATIFDKARRSATSNTKLYLSLVHDLDVYMATSMRNKNDFINMAKISEEIFSNKKISNLNLRYFDPTISAAEGHEDKGLIECLMVKCCKVLVYSAGKKESYGKDAEAAMALSLGKPVIFLCDTEQKRNFYKDIHPLSKLINFQTGVANGILVVDSIDNVSELLNRIFTNTMEYKIIQKESGYFQLIDKLTNSVVRLQTNDGLITSSFWNYYHS